MLMLTRCDLLNSTNLASLLRSKGFVIVVVVVVVVVVHVIEQHNSTLRFSV